MNRTFITVLGILVVIVGGLYLIFGFNDKLVEVDPDNPYGKDLVHEATAEQLDDPLYQGIMVAQDVEQELEAEQNMTIYFYSPTCEHCQEATPVLVPLTEELGVDMKKVNVLEEEQGVVKSAFDVTRTPTLVHYQNGEEIARLVGNKTKEEFTSFLTDYAVEN